MNRRKKPFRLAIAAVAAAFAALYYGYTQRGAPVPQIERKIFAVEYVIDGDTVVTSGGVKVRYIGINAPEFGEPYYDEAKKRNTGLVTGKAIKLIVCAQGPLDPYGRTLAWVYSDGVFVNGALLKEGLARTLIISPCALERVLELKILEKEARLNSRGLWALKPYEGYPVISPGEAYKFIGKNVRVRGKVFGVRRGKSAVFINFGPAGADGFSAVIFEKGLKQFSSAGVDLEDFKGKLITVAGQVKRYKERPEIVVAMPEQIEALE